MPSSPNFKYTPIAERLTDQQPKPSSPPKYDEKIPSHDHAHHPSSSHCECESQRNGVHGDSGHRHCHNSRLRRFLVPAVIAFVVLGGLMTLGCTMTGYGPSSWGSDLVSRALGDGTTGSGTNSPFVDRKFYLIVVFVGLVVVLFLAICLSAWCCKGSFQNPICCPCYLCACCGGLACLECLACGLCCEGLAEI